MIRNKYETEFSHRQYMLQPDVEIRYCSETEHFSVEEHAHDFYEIYHFLEGNIDFYVEEKTFHPEPDSLIIIPPGKSHHLLFRKKKETPYRRIVIWISKAFAETLFAESKVYRYIFDLAEQGDCSWKMETLIANNLMGIAFDMIEENWEQRFGQREILLAETRRYLLTLNRYLYESRNRHRKSGSNEEIVYQNICDYINHHLGENLSLEELGRKFFLSKYYIAHLFKEKVGLSAHQYITKKRLSACRDAMFTSQNLNEICSDYGFTDYSSFYRTFRKEYGQSPQEYRRNHMPDTEEWLKVDKWNRNDIIDN